MKLTPLNMHSIVEKAITLEGCPITVTVEIQKSIRIKEMERVMVAKKYVGEILPPFVQSESVKPEVQQPVVDDSRNS